MKYSKLVQLCGAAALCGLAWSSPAIAQQASKTDGIDAHFKAMDTNGDGKLSREEHAAGARRLFEAMDTNRDGKVTAAEMDAAHQKSKVGGRKAEEDQKPSKAAKSEMSSAEKIKVVDANGDGILTPEEHAAGSRMMFEKMDSNKDGFLTPSEMAAGHEKMMSKAK